jgi:hypothetical protein
MVTFPLPLLIGSQVSTDATLFRFKPSVTDGGAGSSYTGAVDYRIGAVGLDTDPVVSTFFGFTTGGLLRWHTAPTM